MRPGFRLSSRILLVRPVNWLYVPNSELTSRILGISPRICCRRRCKINPGFPYGVRRRVAAFRAPTRRRSRSLGPSALGVIPTRSLGRRGGGDTSPRSKRRHVGALQTCGGARFRSHPSRGTPAPGCAECGHQNHAHDQRRRALGGSAQIPTHETAHFHPRASAVCSMNLRVSLSERQRLTNSD